MENEKTLLSISIKNNLFPRKLWHLVNNPQIISICWDSSGEGILIIEEAFKAEMLSPDKKQVEDLFKLTDFNSFIRQLNLYGFKKVPQNHDLSDEQLVTIDHFYNPNFKRANPELLVNLKRLTPANRAKLADGLEVPSQSRRYQYLMLNSPQKHTAVAKNELPTASFPQYFRDGQQVKQYDITPTSSQSFVNGEGNPDNEFRHFLVDAPSAHPYSPMQECSQYARPDKTIEAFIPHHTEHRLTASSNK